MDNPSLPIQGQVSSTVAKRFDDPCNYGRPRRYNAHARITGPCGDTMEFWLEIENEHVVLAGFTTTGCGPSRAAGSMATELVWGRPVAEAEQLEQSDVLDALAGLPSESEHCALLAANTLKAAIEDHRRSCSQKNHLDLE
jgi:nitrogen fixation protein NifU and related proteins